MGAATALSSALMGLTHFNFPVYTPSSPSGIAVFSLVVACSVEA